MNWMRNRSRSSRGFTLPELLLTALILGYSLSAVLGTFVSTVALNDSSRNLSLAMSHAQFALEEIRNTTFANIATGISSGTWTWSASGITAKGLTPLKSETVTTTSSGTTVLDVNVLVSWQDTNGRTRTKNIRTLISS